MVSAFYGYKLGDIPEERNNLPEGIIEEDWRIGINLGKLEQLAKKYGLHVFTYERDRLPSYPDIEYIHLEIPFQESRTINPGSSFPKFDIKSLISQAQVLEKKIIESSKQMGLLVRPEELSIYC